MLFLLFIKQYQAICFKSCLVLFSSYALLTLYSGLHVCWSEHSDLSFIYGFMSLDYGLGTMTTTTLNPGEVYSTDRSTRRFLLSPALFLCFSVLLSLRLPRLEKRELILVLFVRLFDLRLFGCVCFLLPLASEKGCGF